MINYQSLEVSLPSDNEILLTRGFSATPDLVFDAFTKPDYVRRWLLGPPGWEMPVCEIDLRVGGRFRYVWRHASGEQMAMGGIYREIARPSRVVHNEVYDQDWTGGETLSTMTLTPEGSKTALAITIRYASKAARDGALATGMTDGMNAGFARLDGLLGELAAA